MAKIVEVEIAVTALDQQRLSWQMATLRGRIKGMLVGVTSVLPHQQLSADDLAAQCQRVRREEERLTGGPGLLVVLNGPAKPRRIDSDQRHDIYARFSGAGIAIPFLQWEVLVTLSQPVPVRTANELACAAINGN